MYSYFQCTGLNRNKPSIQQFSSQLTTKTLTHPRLLRLYLQRVTFFDFKYIFSKRHRAHLLVAVFIRAGCVPRGPFSVQPGSHHNKRPKHEIMEQYMHGEQHTQGRTRLIRRRVCVFLFFLPAMSLTHFHRSAG